MKKILSVFLAALMLVGVFAVSASAISLEESPTMEASALDLAERSAPVFVQGDDPFAEDFESIQREVGTAAAEANFLTSTYIKMIRDILEHRPNAYKNGMAQADFLRALAAINTAQPANDALNAFLDDEAALREAYAAGTLRETLLSLCNAVYAEQVSIVEQAAKECFKPDALTYAFTYAEFHSLMNVLNKANLNSTQLADIRRGIDMSVLNDKLNFALLAGNYKKAAGIINGLIEDYSKAMAKYGLVEYKAPSFFTKLWNFILKWIFFGWIWM